MASLLRYAQVVPAALAGGLCSAIVVNAAPAPASVNEAWTAADVKFSLAQYFDHTALKVRRICIPNAGLRLMQTDWH